MAEVGNNENVSEEGQLISEEAILQLINLCKTEINNKTDEVNDIITKATFPTIFSTRRTKRKHFVPIELNYKDTICGDKIAYVNNKTYYFTNGNDSKILYFNPYLQQWEDTNKIFHKNEYWFEGKNIWSDGENIYYSTSYKIDNIDEGIISECTFTGLPENYSIRGEYIWTDGENIYHDSGSDHYKLNKETREWSTMNWVNSFDMWSDSIWTDGYNIYCGNGKKLDISNHKWEDYSFTYAPGINGRDIWTDGKDVYFSGDNTYRLNISANTWVEDHSIFDNVEKENKTIEGQYIWTDSYNIYFTDKDRYDTSFILKEEPVNLHYMI